MMSSYEYAWNGARGGKDNINIGKDIRHKNRLVDFLLSVLAFYVLPVPCITNVAGCFQYDAILPTSSTVHFTRARSIIHWQNENCRATLSGIRGVQHALFNRALAAPARSKPTRHPRKYHRM